MYDLTDASVVALATNCGATLQSIRLSRCGNLSDASIIALADHCSEGQAGSLKAVFLDHCGRVSDGSVARLFQVNKQ